MKTFAKRSLLLSALTLSLFSTACDEVSSALDDEGLASHAGSIGD